MEIWSASSVDLCQIRAKLIDMCNAATQQDVIILFLSFSSLSFVFFFNFPLFVKLWYLKNSPMSDKIFPTDRSSFGSLLNVPWHQFLLGRLDPWPWPIRPTIVSFSASWHLPSCGHFSRCCPRWKWNSSHTIFFTDPVINNWLIYWPEAVPVQTVLLCSHKLLLFSMFLDFFFFGVSAHYFGLVGNISSLTYELYCQGHWSW